MTLEWRERKLKHPAYVPEIDLVVVGPDDQPVGFCVCWLLDGVGQIEPLGVHPDYQGMGLGRALEAAALGVMWEKGARKILVDHVSLNEAAIALSLQTGFKQTNNALRIISMSIQEKFFRSKQAGSLGSFVGIGTPIKYCE